MNSYVSTVNSTAANGIVQYINTHKYTVAIAAVFTILGSRTLVTEMSEEAKPFFGNPTIKKIVLFFIFFLYSRDIGMALVVSIFVMCMFPKVFFQPSAGCAELSEDQKRI